MDNLGHSSWEIDDNSTIKRGSDKFKINCEESLRGTTNTTRGHEKIQDPPKATGWDRSLNLQVAKEEEVDHI
jgi:hypothetical protein